MHVLHELLAIDGISYMPSGKLLFNIWSPTSSSFWAYIIRYQCAVKVLVVSIHCNSVPGLIYRPLIITSVYFKICDPK